MIRKLIDKVKKEKKPSRITNDTIKEHRDEILSKGKKFKYPFQYAKHKLVVNTIIIGVAAMVFLVFLGWVELYKLQNMSDIMYRMTRVLPVPVAKVENEDVRYSDYLLIYRSSIAAIENQQGKLTDSDGDKLLIDQYKRQAMDNAQEFSYAIGLARDLGIEITQAQIQEAEKEHRVVDGVERSEESFANIIKNNFGISTKEYERLLKLSLIKKEVEIKIDEKALTLSEKVKEFLTENTEDFSAVTELDAKVLYDETGDFVDVANLDGGRAEQASKLEVGEISDRFVSRNGDGYYFVKLLEKNDGKVKYASVEIPFSELDDRMKNLFKDGKIFEYIELAMKKQENN